MIFNQDNIHEYIGKRFIFWDEDEDGEYTGNLIDVVFRVGINNRGYCWVNLHMDDVCDIIMDHNYPCFPYDLDNPIKKIFKYNHRNKEQFALEANSIFK